MIVSLTRAATTAWPIVRNGAAPEPSAASEPSGATWRVAARAPAGAASAAAVAVATAMRRRRYFDMTSRPSARRAPLSTSRLLQPSRRPVAPDEPRAGELDESPTCIAPPSGPTVPPRSRAVTAPETGRHLMAWKPAALAAPLAGLAAFPAASGAVAVAAHTVDVDVAMRDNYMRVDSSAGTVAFNLADNSVTT